MKEKIISATYANVFSVVLFVMVLGVSIVPFIFLYGFNLSLNSFLPFVTCIAIVIAILTHELIHGLFFWIYSGNRHSVKFGFNFQYFAPYTHSDVPLRRNHYVVVCIMPTVILGLLPLIIAYIVANIYLLLFAIIMISGGAGDILMTWKMMKFDKNTRFLDHPTKMGFMYDDGRWQK